MANWEYGRRPLVTPKIPHLKMSFYEVIKATVPVETSECSKFPLSLRFPRRLVLEWPTKTRSYIIPDESFAYRIAAYIFECRDT